MFEILELLNFCSVGIDFIGVLLFTELEPDIERIERIKENIIITLVGLRGINLNSTLIEIKGFKRLLK